MNMRQEALQVLTDAINEAEIHAPTTLESTSLERVKELLISEIGTHIENVYPPQMVTYMIGKG